MSRPIKPRVSNKPDDYTGKNPLNIFLDIPKENLGKATPRPRMMIIKDGGNDGSI